MNRSFCFKPRLAALILIIALVCPLLAGCLESASLDEFGYALSIGVQKGEQKTYRIYLLVQKESSDAEAQQSGGGTVLGAEGNSIFDALEIINLGAPYQINLTRVEYIAFSEEIARSELMQEFLSLSFNSLRMQKSVNLLVVEGNIDEFFEGYNLEETPNITKLQYDISRDLENMGLVSVMNASEFFESVLNKRADAVLGYGVIDSSIVTSDEQTKQEQGGGQGGGQGDEQSGEEGGEEGKPEDTLGGIQRFGGMKSAVYGCAVFDGWKMAGVLDGHDTQALLMARGEFVKGTLVLNVENGILAVGLSAINKPNIRIELEPELKAELSISIRCSIRQDSTGLVYKYRIADIEQMVEKHLETQLDRIFKGCLEMNSDAIGFGRAAAMKFSSAKKWEEYRWKDQFQRLQASFKVNVDIDDEGTKQGME